jgi:hypothetical protein
MMHSVWWVVRSDDAQCPRSTGNVLRRKPAYVGKSRYNPVLRDSIKKHGINELFNAVS